MNEKEPSDAPSWYSADEAHAWANGFNAALEEKSTASAGEPHSTEQVRATHDVYRIGSDSSYQETPCFCPARQTHPVAQTLPLTSEPISPEELAIWWNAGADLNAVQRLITRVIELGQLREDVGAATVQMRAVDVILDNLDHPLFDRGNPRMNVEKVVRALAAAGLFRGDKSGEGTP